ncbi:MFS transporter [Sphingopyxis granuli]|uniref:MFS transporter n=1 Tax=Sphingopyxis granuli TaxID=267128 RepID=UPI00301D324F
MSTNIDEVIEREPLGRLRLLLLILISLTIIVDGFDIQMIAFVSPVLIEQWGVTKSDLAIAVSAAFVGMAVGAPLGGWIGDKWGRRNAITASVFFFGIATMAVALAGNLTELSLLRFIGGLGFGAVLPNATALIAEWMPSTIRSYAISMMIVGVPVGGMFGASVSHSLISAFGWESCFLAGGALGVILGPLLWAFLPESPKFLLRRSPSSPELPKLMQRAFPARGLGDAGSFSTEDVVGASRSAIFAPSRRMVTIGLTVAFFANLLVFYGFANWMPTILTSKGLPLEVALRGALYFNLFGLAGAVAVAAIVSKVGARKGLLGVLVGGIAASILLALVIETQPIPPQLVTLTLAVAGMFLAGLQVGLYALAAGAYPTDCRSTGVGFAAGVGRLGPILSAVAGGIFLDMKGGSVWFFSLAVLFLIVAIVGVTLVREGAPAPLAER